jgi:hypothetical protein
LALGARALVVDGASQDEHGVERWWLCVLVVHVHCGDVWGDGDFATLSFGLVCGGALGGVLCR